MKGIHVEVFLACGYALFLVGTALVLEWIARGTHKRSKLYRLKGFTFHEHLDAWQCPNGEYLRRAETDSTLKAVRYRARAAGCNACALKATCTDSDRGREIVHSTQDWIETETGHFNRGISLALMLLSFLILAAVWIRHHAPTESAVLGIALAGIGLLSYRMTARLLRKEKAGKPPAWIPLTPWTGGETPRVEKRAKPFM